MPRERDRSRAILDFKTFSRSRFKATSPHDRSPPRSDPFPSPIQRSQGKFKSIALIRATDENAAPQNGGEGESPTRVGPQPGPNTSPPPRVTFHPSHADNNSSPFYPTGGVKPAAIGLKRSVGARADPAKKARVLRFVIR